MKTQFRKVSVLGSVLIALVASTIQPASAGQAVKRKRSYVSIVSEVPHNSVAASAVVDRGLATQQEKTVKLPSGHVVDKDMLLALTIEAIKKGKLKVSE